MDSLTTINQNGVTATLSEVEYHGADGFVADNTWQVAEETLHAGSDNELKDGPAVIEYAGTAFSVNVTVLQFGKEPIDEDDDPEDEPVCEIEIAPVKGTAEKLAASLGLLGHYTKSQLRDVVKRSQTL